MTIVADLLRNWDLPVVRQTYGAREVALYALSIGIGRDPLDTHQLVFVGEEETAISAFPSMATVLADPGFWFAHERFGVDSGRVVHGEQAVAIHRPLPAAATVIGRTRVTALVDKGPGKSALLHTEKTLHNDASGELLATTRMVNVLRGQGGFDGAPADVGQPTPMPKPPADLTFDFETRPEQALLYRWNGDHNPLHLMPRAARAAGFERPILHGMCTFGIAAQSVAAALCGYNASRIAEIRGRFTAAVYPGDGLRTEIWRDGVFRVTIPSRGAVAIDHGSFVLNAS